MLFIFPQFYTTGPPDELIAYIAKQAMFIGNDAKGSTFGSFDGGSDGEYTGVYSLKISKIFVMVYSNFKKIQIQIQNFHLSSNTFTEHTR